MKLSLLARHSFFSVSTTFGHFGAAGVEVGAAGGGGTVEAAGRGAVRAAGVAVGAAVGRMGGAPWAAW